MYLQFLQHFFHKVQKVEDLAQVDLSQV